MYLYLASGTLIGIYHQAHSSPFVTKESIQALFLFAQIPEFTGFDALIFHSTNSAMRFHHHEEILSPRRCFMDDMI